MIMPTRRPGLSLVFAALLTPGAACAADAPAPEAAPAPATAAAATPSPLLPALAPAEAAAVIAADDPPQVLDVRSADEFAMGHVPGAVLIPHDELAARLAELDRDRPVLVYCRSGRRSTIAETLLREQGFDVRQIEGSWLRWEAEKLPVAVPAAPAPVLAAPVPVPADAPDAGNER